MCDAESGEMEPYNSSMQDMRHPMMRIALSFWLAASLTFTCTTSADEWVKHDAGRDEYVRDRTACAHDAQMMALVGEDMQKDIANCLAHKGWQRNQVDSALDAYCYETETIKACKAGGTLDLYKGDRSYCWDHVLSTVGNTYSQPGWIGIAGLIDSHVTASENKANLERSQLVAMGVCLEGKSWAVDWKGASAVSQDSTAKVDTQCHSPMVLTTPFPLADRSLWGNSGWTDPEAMQQLRDFRCDGIAITEMRMRGKLRNDGKLEVAVKGEFDSVRGHDKRVDMKYELLNGDTIVGVGYSKNLKAPEGKQKRFSFDFDIPADQLQGKPATQLRITFSDYDD
jgi:hypothetical protein